MGEGFTVFLVLIHFARDDAAARCGSKGFVAEDHQEDRGTGVHMYEWCRV